MLITWFVILVLVRHGGTSWSISNNIPFPLKSVSETDISSEQSQIPRLSIRDHIPTYIRRVYSPKKKHMKAKKLVKILGNHYDSDWMSVDKPEILEEIPNDELSQSRLRRELDNLKINLTTSAGAPLDVQEEVFDSIKEWLLEKSTCPVHFFWEDLGGMFWPRWIKKGRCVVNKPCSWPNGMHCVPAENRIIYILRWQCRNRRKYYKRGRKHDKNRSRRNILKSGDREQDEKDKPKDKKKRRKRNMRLLRCRWIRIPFPVLDHCFCSC